MRAGEEVRKRREVIETGTEGHVMIGYKLVEVVFPYLGLQQRAESLIKDSQVWVGVGGCGCGCGCVSVRVCVCVWCSVVCIL